jgi:2Fe-2S ferredoxin
MPNVTFVDRGGAKKTVSVKAGLTLLEIAHQHDFDLEGSCEGSLACSTCHLVIAPEWYGKLPPASEEEADMLDFASGLTKTSRLGCQIIVGDHLDGLEVRLPNESRNMAAD